MKYGTATALCWTAAAFLLLLVGACEKQAAGDTGQVCSWPRWGGPDGNWVSKETGWNPEALNGSSPVAWTANIGVGYSNVAIQGGRLFTMGSDIAKQTYFCLDATSGKVLWKYSQKFMSTPPQSTPAVDGELVYMLRSDGLLHCFFARSGRIKWSKQLVREFEVLRPQYGFSGSPVVEGNLVLITCNAYGIALDKETGKVAWKSPTEDPNLAGRSMIDAYATPVVYTQGDKRYLCQFNGYGVYAVNVKTGQPKWFYSWPPGGFTDWANVADPIVHDDKVFISTGYGIG